MAGSQRQADRGCRSARRLWHFRLSPDEKSIVFNRIETGNIDIWVLDITRGVPSRISFDPGVDNLPIWSHDGLRILWPSNRSGAFHLYIKAATGAGEDELFIKMGTTYGWGNHWSATESSFSIRDRTKKQRRGFVDRAAVTGEVRRQRRNRLPTCSRRSQKGMACFLPMDTGSPTSPASRVARKSTCRHFLSRTRRTGSQLGRHRSGMAQRRRPSCFISPPTAA